MADFDGKGFYGGRTVGEPQPNETGAGVERARLVEDEVADAVVDTASTIVFDGLQRVAVMANEEIGSGFHQLVGQLPLCGGGLEFMFAPPMQAHDEIGLWMLYPQTTNASQERVFRFLTYARSMGQISVVFEW